MDGKYRIEILRSAQKQLADIEPHARARVLESIRALSADPRPPGCKKLVGRPAWRIRVGSYRVIYEIHDDRLVVLVVRLGDRKDVYREQG